MTKLRSLSQLFPLKPPEQSHTQVPPSRVPPFWHNWIQAVRQEARTFNSIVTIVSFPLLTRGPSIITNDQCHNCLHNKTNDRCVLVPAGDTLARIPQCLADMHNSFQGRKYTLTSTGVPTVTICTGTCTGWFTACSSILTHQSTCCNSEETSSKAGGSIYRYNCKKYWPIPNWVGIHWASKLKAIICQYDLYTLECYLYTGIGGHNPAWSSLLVNAVTVLHMEKATWITESHCAIAVTRN